MASRIRRIIPAALCAATAIELAQLRRAPAPEAMGGMWLGAILLAWLIILLFEFVGLYALMPVVEGLRLTSLHAAARAMLLTVAGAAIGAVMLCWMDPTTGAAAGGLSAFLWAAINQDDLHDHRA